jgi:hypothetical protein
MKDLVDQMNLKEVLKKTKRGEIQHVSLQMCKSILNITESGLARIINTIKYSERSLQSVQDYLTTPACMNQFVRMEVRGLRMTMERCQDTVADLCTLRKAKEDSKFRQNQDVTSVSRETMKDLSFSKVVKFIPHKTLWIEFIDDFLKRTCDISLDTLKLRKLKESLSQDEEKTLLMSQYQDTEFQGALEELNQKFANPRQAWAHLATMINKCPKKCNSLPEQRELFLFSDYIFKRVKQFTQLGEFMTSQWFLMNIYDRLGNQAKVKFVELRREYNLTNSVNLDNMDFYFQVYLPRYDSMLREEKILTEGAHIDILTQYHPSGIQKPKKTSAATQLTVTQAAATGTGFQEGGSSGNPGRENKRDGGRNRHKKPGKTSDTKSPGRGKSPGAKPRTAKTCRICCRACGYLCEGVFEASRGSPADREQMVRKCQSKKVCPGCFADVIGENHRCLDQRTTTDKRGVKKTIDMARLRCKEPGCRLFLWGNNISLSNRLCKCPRRASTMTSVIQEDNSWDHSKSGLISLCPQEVVARLVPGGGVARVLVTYDMASDSKLASRNTIQDLAHSWKRIKYHLKTAVGEQVHTEQQGQLHIIREQGSILKLTFIGVGGQGVLSKRTMPPVKFPMECLTEGWEPIHRDVSCEYHIILDAGCLEHHPEKVLYRNRTGSTLILQSKITGRPVPLGLFQPATSQQPEWFNYNHGPQNEEEEMGWGEASPSDSRMEQDPEDEPVPAIFNRQGSSVQEPGSRRAVNTQTQHKPSRWGPPIREVEKKNPPFNLGPAEEKERGMAQPPIHQTDRQTSAKRNSDNLTMKTGSIGPNSTTGSTIPTLMTSRERRHQYQGRQVGRQVGRPRTTAGPGDLPRQYQFPCTEPPTPDQGRQPWMNSSQMS